MDNKKNIVVKNLYDICMIPKLLCLGMSFICTAGIFMWRSFTVNEFQWSASGFFSFLAVWNFALVLVLRHLDANIVMIATPPAILALFTGPLQMGAIHFLMPSYALAGILPYICMIPVGALQICLYVYFANVAENEYRDYYNISRKRIHFVDSLFFRNDSYCYDWVANCSDIIPKLIKWGFFVGTSIQFSKIMVSSAVTAVVFAIFLAIMEIFVPEHFDYMDATKTAFNFWMATIICSAGYGIFILLYPGIILRSIWGYIWYVIVLMCTLGFNNMRRRID